MIVELAKQKQADLIALGTHGRRGLSHMLLGSVAERVVRTRGDARCVTVRAQATSRRYLRSRPRM